MIRRWSGNLSHSKKFSNGNQPFKVCSNFAVVVDKCSVDFSDIRSVVSIAPAKAAGSSISNNASRSDSAFEKSSPVGKKGINL